MNKITGRYAEEKLIAKQVESRQFWASVGVLVLIIGLMVAI